MTLKETLSTVRKNLKWLDPFTYVDLYLMPIANPNNDKLLGNIVYIITAFIFAFILYTGLGLLLSTSSPIVIVLSGSMEPSMYRGDVVFLTGTSAEGVAAQELELNTPLQGVPFPMVGSVDDRNSKVTLINGETATINREGNPIVYRSTLMGEQIIHRAVLKIKASDGTYILTKGDANPSIDQDCGALLENRFEKPCIEPFLIPSSQIDGKVIFKIPLLGYIKLLLVDDISVLLFGCSRPQGCQFP